MKFVGFDFRDAIIQNSDLSGSDFSSSYLRDIDLKGSKVRSSIFVCADIRGGDLEGVDATAAVFVRAYMCGAYIKNAVFKDTKIGNAFLSGTYFEATDIRGMSGLDTAHGIEATVFRQTIVTDEQRRQIESRKSTKIEQFVIKTEPQLRKEK